MLAEIVAFGVEGLLGATFSLGLKTIHPTDGNVKALISVADALISIDMSPRSDVHDRALEIARAGLRNLLSTRIEQRAAMLELLALEYVRDVSSFVKEMVSQAETLSEVDKKIIMHGLEISNQSKGPTN